MLGFKKKQKPVVQKPDGHEAVRQRLEETDNRLTATLKEMRRRLAEKERPQMMLGVK